MVSLSSLYFCTMAASKKDIRALSREELKAYFESLGEKPFRANQVYEWLWKKSATSFEMMSNLSKPTRKMLDQHFDIKPAIIEQTQKSTDRTIKSTFRLRDGLTVEGVLIPTEKRMTACISSQVGCSLSCKFCATGQLKMQRNLDAGEIYDQAVNIWNQAKKEYGAELTNIVYMGMGEPLLNYKATLASIHYLTSEDGLNMASRRITVSTAGIAKQIRQLGDDNVKFNLALSLHAANDEKRSQVMAINDSNSLDVLRESLKYFYSKTKNQITFEYILFKDFNDSLQDAEELFLYTKHLPSKVNIIEYNPVDNTGFTKSDNRKMDAFAAYLDKRGVTVKVRRSRGKDIDAACGQLAGKSS